MGDVAIPTAPENEAAVFLGAGSPGTSEALAYIFDYPDHVWSWQAWFGEDRGRMDEQHVQRMRWIALAIGLMLPWAGCASPDEEAPPAPAQTRLFDVLGPDRTGIDFSNFLSERPTPRRNVLTFEYFTNGAGVAVGDLNGDGLDDIFFTGNMTYNRLYLNRGNMRFEDVTQASGVAGRRDTWKTGATMADVNGDGLLDIYVCYSGNLPLERRVDELYINLGTDEVGIPRFAERAAEYGLANPHSSNQAYFFDYDLDGDLDLFLLTHNVNKTPRRDEKGTREQLGKEDPVNGNRFYENRDGYFVDVTSSTGIQSSELTYGLGAGISDFNGDGWPDLYVGNDYSPPDYLYINQRDGTFVDELKTRLGHTSDASMGVDVADVNNDGLVDLIVLDMLGESNYRQKQLYVPNDRELHRMNLRAGFHHQYMRNMLQLNNGDGTFSEIGQLAGVSNTDWSWAALFADYDNDGLKDLFVTNGILYDMIDQDYLNFKWSYLEHREFDLTPDDITFMMSRLPSYDLQNYMFRNTGNLVFENVSAAWGLNLATKSNGAAYSDFDGDGDLDLVVNNVNEPAYIFENRSSGRNHLKIDLKGRPPNTYGIGARLTLYAGGSIQYLEQMPMRGYLSSVSPTLHFGLGDVETVDSLVVVWPDGAKQTLRGVEANQRLTVRQEEADEVHRPAPPRSPLFEATEAPVRFVHQIAGGIDDFFRQPLLVNPKSYDGPVLKAADVNGDGLDDVFAGGGDGQASRIFLQQPGGSFTATSQPALDADRRSSDTDAAFADFNGDGFVDLYVASGGYGHFAVDDAALQDRLYLGDGRGGFTRAPSALPEMRTSTGAVAVADVDGDGHLDVFAGGGVVPGRYPEPPRSYVLINDGQGRFEDRTAEIAPELEQIGMVTDARWHDLDGDGSEELVVVGDWMPISIFENDGGTLRNVTDRYFDWPQTGLWNVLLIDDLNGDGTPDILAGNLGLNSQLRARMDQPAELFYADFNGDGSVDPVLTYYIQGIRYPHMTLEELARQLYFVARRFPSFEAYSNATLEDIFTPEELQKARVLEARVLETSLYLGKPGGRFEKAELPIEAQISPVYAIATTDFDGDGITDLVLGGNVNEARLRFGRYDASYGVLLRGTGGGAFEYVPQHESGFKLAGDVRSIVEIGGVMLFGVNRGAVAAYRRTSEPARFVDRVAASH